MISAHFLFLPLFLPLFAQVGASSGQPMGSVFTYQGQLKQGGVPVNATCDFEFSLWDDPLAADDSHRLGGQTQSAAEVMGGLFTVELDFGSEPFSGDARWLQVAICCRAPDDPPERCAGPPTYFTTLDPRQKLGPVPYALHSGTALASDGHSLDAADGDPVDAIFVDDNGSVGIGTPTPEQSLSVQGGMNIDQADANDGELDADAPVLRFGAGASGEAIASKRIGAGRLRGLDFYTAGTMHMSIGNGGEVKFYNQATDAGRADTITLDAHFGVEGDGAIVMRNPSRTETLRVSSGTAATGASEVLMFDPNGRRTVRIRAAEGGDQGSDIELSNAAGEVTIQLDADVPGTREGRVITQVLQITGGSDLSEQFDVNAAGAGPVPGTVVCIDPKNPGQLIVCNQPYDRRVVGVISGAGGVKPGMLMGQKGSMANGKHPVALTGRVYVLADGSHSPIQPGDLLTTSDTPGYAMKVTDYANAPGSVLGKAMTALPSGKGLVLILVSLQ